MISVALPPDVTDAGLKEAVTPLGAPVRDRLTVWALPLVVAVDTVTDPEPPAWIDVLTGLTAIEKPFAAAAIDTTQLFWEFENSVCTT
jgi:hypothetical protein